MAEASPPTQGNIEDILSTPGSKQNLEWENSVLLNGRHGPRIRAMTERDLSRILHFRAVVRWSGDPRSFDLLRGTKEVRWAVAETSNGALVGMVGAVPLGRVGILCHLAVHEDYRGFGLGSRLSRWAVAYLRSRGTRTIRLYATRKAEGLYRSLGFSAVASRRIYRLKASGGERSIKSAESECRVKVLGMGDLAEVYGLDLWSHGGDRSPLIFATLRSHPGQGLVARDSSGVLKGYLVRSGGPLNRIGPFVAASPQVARGLLDNALWNSGDSNVEVTVTGPGPVRDLLPELGFEGVVDRLRMELGESLDCGTASIFEYGTTPYLAT